ncbi:MAG: hypothetical protein WA667_07045 [Candidatus Nitrosopolaris sp.]
MYWLANEKPELTIMSNGSQKTTYSIFLPDLQMTLLVTLNCTKNLGTHDPYHPYFNLDSSAIIGKDREDSENSEDICGIRVRNNER